MDWLGNLFSFLALCMGLFITLDIRGMVMTVVAGSLLGMGAWYACNRFSRLWNRRFQTTRTHAFFCFFAALLTLGYTVLFDALKYAKEAAYASVLAWEIQLNGDSMWADTTYATAFGAVRRLGLEDFSSVPLPGVSDTHIPTTHRESILVAAKIYAEAAERHFDQSRPFLSKLIDGRSRISQQHLEADIINYFATVDDFYPPRRGITLVAAQTRQELDQQVPRVVVYARVLLVIAFLFTQAIPFGLVGFVAYKQLKVHT